MEKVIVSGLDITGLNYNEVCDVFANAPGALCENAPPHICPCDECPLREICEWICANDPYTDEWRNS